MLHTIKLTCIQHNSVACRIPCTPTAPAAGNLTEISLPVLSLIFPTIAIASGLACRAYNDAEARPAPPLTDSPHSNDLHQHVILCDKDMCE